MIHPPRLAITLLGVIVVPLLMLVAGAWGAVTASRSGARKLA